MVALRSSTATRGLYRLAVGYQRPFATLQEAKNNIAPYSQGGHEHPRNALLHLDLSRSARPSDYAALFHIAGLAGSIERIFDLGGNVGNLYYCYANYLPRLQQCSWTVLDMPANLRFGQNLANERGVRQLSFTEDWRCASGCDLLIVSGSLHYFEEPVDRRLAMLESPPRYILVNRTPLTDAATVAVVQDAGDFLVACLLRNRQELLRQFSDAGYTLLDRWEAAELSLDVPSYPEYRVPAYSGFFFERSA